MMISQILSTRRLKVEIGAREAMQKAAMLGTI